MPAPVVDETPAPQSNVTETALGKEEQEESSAFSMDNNEPSGVAPIQPIQHQDPPLTPQIQGSTFSRPGSATPR